MRGSRYGDFSRSPLERLPDEGAVLMQQGRVQLDSDWNDQAALQQQRAETALADLLGIGAGPDHDLGFEIRPLIGLGIEPGSLVLVEDGSDFELVSPVAFALSVRARLPGVLLSWSGDDPSERYELTVHEDGRIGFRWPRRNDEGHWSEIVARHDLPALPWPRPVELWILYDEGTLTMFVNGHEATVRRVRPLQAARSRFTIGSRTGGAGALVSDLRLWADAARPGNHPRHDLVSRWPLDEGRGLIAYDVIGGNDARVEEDPRPGWRLVDLDIGRGRYYAGGVTASLREPVRFTKQPANPRARLPDHEGRYLLFLEVWERSVSVAENPALREVALRGLDTTVLTQTIPAVHALRLADGDPPPDALLLERTPSDTAGAMAAVHDGEVPPRNSLYRVEVHRDGEADHATFKWSRTNGSVVLPVAPRLEGARTFSLLPTPTGDLPLSAGDVVEVVDDDVTMANDSHPLLVVEDVSRDDWKVTLSHAPAHAVGTDAAKHPFLRRWDQQYAKETGDGAPRLRPEEWIELEDGIAVKFDEGHYRRGDYWWIVARQDTGAIEWPDRHGHAVALPPAGVERRRAPLAILDLGAEVVVHDLRSRIFPPVVGPGPRGGPETPPEPADTVEPVQSLEPAEPVASEEPRAIEAGDAEVEEARSAEVAVVAAPGRAPAGFRPTGRFLVTRATWSPPRSIPVAAGQVVLGAADVDGTPVVVTRTQVWALADDGGALPLTTLPEPRERFGCCAIGEIVYVVGGTAAGRGRADGKTFAYDVGADAWSSRAPMPVPVKDFALVTHQGIARVLGGLRTWAWFDFVTDAHQLYDPAGDSWRFGPALTSPRCSAAAASIGEDVHLVGGRGRWLLWRPTLADHDVLDEGAPRWDPAPPLPEPRYDAAGTGAGGVVLIAGGVVGAGATSTATSFDPIARTWSPVGSMTTGLERPAAFVRGDTTHVVGTRRGRTLAQSVAAPVPFELYVPGGGDENAGEPSGG